MRRALSIALLLVVGSVADAWAKCPPGTKYQCVPCGNQGKLCCSCS